MMGVASGKTAERRAPRHRLLAALPALLIAGCGLAAPASAGRSSASPGTPAPSPPATASSSPAPLVSPPGAVNVYSAATATTVRADLAGIPERVYVPNSLAATVDVIDPKTYRVVEHLRVGAIPYHVTPAWDLTKLYVDNEGSGSLQVVDPASRALGGAIAVPYPYNLYFTPDGSRAIVVDERQRRLLFMDPHTWTPFGGVDVPWSGVDHLDFSADGSFFLASCEFSGAVVKVDVGTMAVTGMVNVRGLPIDVRLSPDGSVFYVANQGRGGVSVVDPVAMTELGFIATGRGAHGLQLSRDARSLYVSNRLAGSISVIDFATRTVRATWATGGSPDMMQISPDGRELWVSARFDRLVYVVDTISGAVTHRIAVGASPHGLAYFPNPGRFSLGHNGVYR